MGINRLFLRLLGGVSLEHVGRLMEETNKRLDEHAQWTSEVIQRLAELERLVEATRQKVYREGKKEELEQILEQPPAPTNPWQSLRSGETVPDSLLNQF